MSRRMRAIFALLLAALLCLTVCFLSCNRNQGGNTEGNENQGGNTEGNENQGGNTEGNENQGGNTEGNENQGGNTAGNENQGGNTEENENQGGNTEGNENQGGNTEGNENQGGNTEGDNETNTGDLVDRLNLPQFDPKAESVVWNAVEGALGYIVTVNGEDRPMQTDTFAKNFPDGRNTVSVRVILEEKDVLLGTVSFYIGWVG